ncbi:hypothetical protein E4U09_005054 [Claviceps aff. purpurea]|uniref:Uncharacterized protein n=1 Tax=Claviceps aff. purpurea TaxID=1967640 RepID=A0A9P7U470_9HYPO|nr:hypothetical protein E4U09_005054 [Claviceps aff. purpurea]
MAEVASKPTPQSRVSSRSSFLIWIELQTFVDRYVRNSMYLAQADWARYPASDDARCRESVAHSKLPISKRIILESGSSEEDSEKDAMSSRMQVALSDNNNDDGTKIQ